MQVNAFRRRWMPGKRSIAAVAMVTVSIPAMADAFGSAHYDPKNDQLIVTMLYDGTTPNHHFSIQWGPCRKVFTQLHEPPRKVIEVDIVDDQGNDAATRSYSEIVRVPLAGMSCRPSSVVLWTQPDVTISLDIP